MDKFDAWRQQQMRDADPEDAAPRVRVLRQHRGVVRRGRACTLCHLPMPVGTPYRADVLIDDDGKFTYETWCGGEECPQTTERCRACDGRGGEYYPLYAAGADEMDQPAGWELQRCPSCDGSGRVARRRPATSPSPSTPPAPRCGPDRLPF